MCRLCVKNVAKHSAIISFPRKREKENKELGVNTHYLVKRKDGDGTYFDVEDKKDE